MKHPLTSTQWEHNTRLLLGRRNVLDVIAIQLEDFCALHKHKPDIVFLAPQLRTAFVRAVVAAAGLSTEAAVAEPVWYDGIPILFNAKETAGDYIVLRHGARRLERRL